MISFKNRTNVRGDGRNPCQWMHDNYVFTQYFFPFTIEKEENLVHIRSRSNYPHQNAAAITI